MTSGRTWWPASPASARSPASTPPTCPSRSPPRSRTSKPATTWTRRARGACRASRQFAVAAAQLAADDAKLVLADDERAARGLRHRDRRGRRDRHDGRDARPARARARRASARSTSRSWRRTWAPARSRCTSACAGPALASVAACASGLYSYIEAKQLIDSGRADVVLAGGTEAALHPLPIAALANMKALSRRNDEPTRASRPFDRDRDGFVFGEGAVVMVIESEARAKARNAHVYAELARRRPQLRRLPHHRAARRRLRRRRTR